MSVETARARFRRSERKLMNSTGTVFRPSGDPVFNPNTGGTTQPGDAVAVTGDMLVRTAAWQGGDVMVGADEVRLRPWRIKLPHDDPTLFKNDVVTVTSSDNPALVGRVFRITDFYGDDWSPSAPYFAEEVT